MSRWTTQLVLFGVAVGALSGCARVVPLAAPSSTAAATPPAVPSAPSSVSDGGPTLEVPLPSVASSSGFDEAYAVSCAGHPSADRVLALLRTKGVPAGATIQDGPLCAGTWQYTVVLVSPRQPVQVITQGPPDRLELVTMGTDVCTIPVKTQAPLGIQTVAHCN
jgi:hypothetical protein